MAAADSGTLTFLDPESNSNSESDDRKRTTCNDLGLTTTSFLTSGGQHSQPQDERDAVFTFTLPTQEETAKDAATAGRTMTTNWADECDSLEADRNNLAGGGVGVGGQPWNDEQVKHAGNTCAVY